MSKVLLYISAVVSLLYVFVGVFIAFSNKGVLLAPYPYHVFLGVLILSYGLFRSYRFYRLFFGKKDE